MRRVVKQSSLIIISFIIFISCAIEINVYATSDIDKPVMTSITIDKRSVTVGDEVTVTATIEDNSSIRFAHLVLQNGQYNSDYIYLESQDDGTYKGSIRISSNYHDGKYTLGWYDIADVAGNEYMEWNFDIHPEIYFVVTGCSNDVDKPELTSIEIDKRSATVGDEVTVTATIEDDSNIRFAHLVFQNGQYNSDYVYLELQGDGIYKGSFIITNNYHNGKYLLGWYDIADVAGNECL